MSMIPEEIIIEILIKLPARELRRLRCVSKSWCSLIGSHSFFNMHLNHSVGTNSNQSLVLSDGREIFCLYVEDLFEQNSNRKLVCPRKLSPRSVVFGSCNGLVLLCDWYLPTERKSEDFMDDFGIWNPNTREYKSLPDPPQYNETEYRRYEHVSHVYGFGFDSTRDDYKLVKVTYFLSSNELSSFCEVDIYSLKSDSWSRIKEVPFPLDMQYLYQVNGAFASGTLHLHWAGRTSDGGCVIFAFDIQSENFHVVAQPDYSVKRRWIRMEELNGKLCLSSRTKDHLYDIWIMGECGMKESWRKLLSIPAVQPARDLRLGHFMYAPYARPLAYSSSGNKILFNRRDGKLVLYDLDKDTKPETSNKQLINGSYVAFSCVDSLVQLRAYDNCHVIT